MKTDLDNISSALATELSSTAPSGVDVTLDPTLGMRTANSEGEMLTFVSIVSSVPASVLSAWLASKLIKHKNTRTRINRKEIHFDSEGNLRAVIEERISKDDQP